MRHAVRYHGHKNYEGVSVEYSDGSRARLPHHVEHSPAGFAWGYWGSGPADLARSLFAHVVDAAVEDVEPIAFRLMLDEVVAVLPREEAWVLSAADLAAWVDSKEAEYGDEVAR